MVQNIIGSVNCKQLEASCFICDSRRASSRRVHISWIPCRRFKPYQILYIAILIKSIAFNHAINADLPFHAISESRVRLLYIDKILTKLKQTSYYAWKNEPSSSTNCVSGIALTVLIIREWDWQEGHDLLFNCHCDPSALWDIFGKLDNIQPTLHTKHSNIPKY